MNVAKLILRLMPHIETYHQGTDNIIDIVYAAFNAQSGGKLPALSDDAKRLIFSLIRSVYFSELLKTWSDDHERDRRLATKTDGLPDHVHHGDGD